MARAVTTFTQADINANSLVYQENGTTATSDVIAFRVTDPNGNSVNGSFPITITPATGNGILDGIGIAQQLELIYVAYFNRAADGAGDSFWSDQNVQAQARGQSAFSRSDQYRQLVRATDGNNRAVSVPWRAQS